MVSISYKGKIYDGPPEQVHQFLTDNPGAVVVGPSMADRITSLAVRQGLSAALPSTSPSPAVEIGQKVLTKTPVLPIAGSFLGGAGGPGGMGLGAGAGEALRQILAASKGQIEPSSLEAAKKIGIQADLGVMGGMANTGVQGAAEAVAPEIQRIGPGLLNTLSGLPETSSKMLFENPQEVASLSKLGKKGIMESAVQSLKNARTALSNLIKNSNGNYNNVQREIISATQGQRVIPIGPVVQNTLSDAANKGFIEGMASTDKMGLSVIKRFVKGATEVSGEEGNISFGDANILRVQINDALQNPRLSNQAKSVLQTFKTSLDENISKGIGENLSSKYDSVLEEASQARRLNQTLSPVFKSKNAPDVIAKNLESGNELSQSLNELDSLHGDRLLSPIRLAVRSQPFGANVLEGMTQGSSLPVAMKGPLGLMSRIPYIGRIFSPPGIASIVAGSTFLPKLAGPIASAAIQTQGEQLNPK